MYPSKDSNVQKAYPFDGGFLQDQRYRLSRITSDSLFICPIDSFLSKAPKQESQVFKYYFDLPWTGGDNETFGDGCKGFACHGSDLLYLLQDPSNGEFPWIV
jgi:hypothetical protein